jgi:excisionase family DNA binding protein
VPDEWLTVDEAMAYLKLSRSTIYLFMSKGRLPYYQVAGTGTRRFKRSDLDALLERGQPSAGKVGAAA